LRLFTMGEEKEPARVHAVIWPMLHFCRLPYAISWPSIASTNWDGRRRRSSAPANTRTMKVDHPSAKT
jgi:hypothetical protein